MRILQYHRGRRLSGTRAGQQPAVLDAPQRPVIRYGAQETI